MRVAAADFYSVGPDVFPTGAGVDMAYDDWFGRLRYGDLLDAERMLSIVAMLETALAPRFDAGAALQVGGPTDPRTAGRPILGQASTKALE